MKLFKRLFSNSNHFVYLDSWLKISLVKTYVRETIVFTFSVLWLILFSIFG